MFVLCPHCQFLVAVDAASGLPPAHCPRCNGALATPSTAAESPVAAVQDELSPASPALQADVTSAASDALPSSLEASATTLEPEASQTPAPPPSAYPLEAPDEALEIAAAVPQDRAASMPARPRKPWSSAPVLAGLSLLLVLQLVLADRAQLAADAQWRPALVVLCDVLRCTLPPWHDPAAFTLLERDVTADAHRAGVLHATARFRNDARWPQPWPKLLLTLSDADGRIAGTRMFVPSEYRAGPATENELASGQTAAVSIDVVEPTPRIVAFTFDFR